jgi:hypothetical protein
MVPQIFLNRVRQIKDVPWFQVIFVIRALNLALAGRILVCLNKKLETNFGSVTVSLPKVTVVVFEIFRNWEMRESPDLLLGVDNKQIVTHWWDLGRSQRELRIEAHRC